MCLLSGMVLARALIESAEPQLVLLVIPCDIVLSLMHACMHAGPSGELRALAANVREVDAGNLLPTWTEAACLGQRRPQPQSHRVAR